MASLEYRQEGGGVYRAVAGDGEDAPTGVLGNAGMITRAPSRMIPLKRTKLDGREHAYLSSIITLEEWALPPQGAGGEAATSVDNAMDLLVAAARAARPDTRRDTPQPASERLARRAARPAHLRPPGRGHRGRVHVRGHRPGAAPDAPGRRQHGRRL